MFNEMLQAAGMSSGMVYATGIMKPYEVKRMVDDFKAQESIQAMTRRILEENNCYVNSKKAAGKGDFDVNDLEIVITPSIPQFMQVRKEVIGDS